MSEPSFRPHGRNLAQSRAVYHGNVPIFSRLLVALSGRQLDEGLLAYAAAVQAMMPCAAVSCVHVETAGPENGDVAARVRSTLPEARLHIGHGDVLDTLIDTAAAVGADVLMMGQASTGRRRRMARRLAMKAPCSVWMVPCGTPPAIRRILAPIDFSERSADTLSVAAALTEASGQDECDALHIYFNDAAVSFDEFDEALAGDRWQRFSIFTAPVDLHGVFTRASFVECSRVAPAIVRFAESAGSDLIVMGTRGRSTSAAVLLGSETEQVLMSSPVPVLAVKHFGSRLRLFRALRDERLRARANERFT
jgi:nucleotide-binding universal stress UspA family protein